VLHIKEESVVEGGFPICAAVVSVGLLGILTLKEDSSVNITRALYIQGFDILGVKDHHTDLKVFRRLRPDVEVLYSVQWNDCRDYVYPKFELALRYARAGVHEGPELNWLMLDTLPFRGEIPIFKVYLGRPNDVITENIIIVHSLYCQGSAAWELAFEFVAFVKLGVRLVFLVEVSVVVNLIATAKN
jgi:hypothetical protein